MGEELRRRLSQATQLVAAMNTSLKSIRTNRGIGVRVGWKLAEETGSDVSRIKTLVSTAAAVRTVTQDNELTDLLSSRVAAEAIRGPAAGYAVHLRTALDYRAWHTVEVVITGPEQEQEREPRLVGSRRPGGPEDGGSTGEAVVICDVPQAPRVTDLVRLLNLSASQHEAWTKHPSANGSPAPRSSSPAATTHTTSSDALVGPCRPRPASPTVSLCWVTPVRRGSRDPSYVGGSRAGAAGRRRR